MDNSVSPAMKQLLQGVENSEKDLATSIENLNTFLKDLVSPVATQKQTKSDSAAAPSLTGNGHGLVYADSDAGRALAATFENSKNKALRPIMPPTPVSAMQSTAMKMSTAAGAGFTGLAGLYGMQIERMAGIAPGANGVFARDRNRLGIASGLNTGGIGEVRKVGAKADQKAARKDDTIIGTNDRLTTANEKLQTQIELLQEALA